MQEHNDRPTLLGTLFQARYPCNTPGACERPRKEDRPRGGVCPSFRVTPVRMLVVGSVRFQVNIKQLDRFSGLAKL